MVFQYKIEREKYENNHDYQRRILFIKKLKPTDKNNLKEYIIMSLIMNNIYNLKCKYPDILQNKVEKAVKNIL
tara:strand:+ start:189 stop:407 length:219 start_codon:yes stop_codon:yes gene_type:complete